MNIVFMQRPAVRFVAIFLLIFLSSSLILMSWPAAPISNVLGLFSVLSYGLTLIPSLIKTLIPNIKRHPLCIWLLKYRRQMGVASFCFGAQHGLIVVVQRSLDMTDMHTYIQYVHGSILFAIFALLMITSNDESVKWLKKNWTRIHQLTYAIPAILLWHVADNMNVQTWITPIAEGLTCLLIGLLILKVWVSRSLRQMKKQKQAKQLALAKTLQALAKSDRQRLISKK